MRYRHERHAKDELRNALIRAGRGVGTPLALAAAATAAGFFSFLPTTYVGVAELGLVAGIGMIVAFVLCITLLPALLMLFKPPGEADAVGFRSLAALDRMMVTRRSEVLRAAAVAAVASLILVTFVKFDFNPLDLRSAKTESVSTILDLMKDPQTSPNTIDVLAPNLDAARALAAKAERDPAGRTGDHAERFRARRSAGQEAGADRRCQPAAGRDDQSLRGQAGAERRGGRGKP